jgi:phosphofructokinase-like protein
MDTPDRVALSNIKRIGILTGGGDCPGLNAVIRAVTKDALNHDIEVYGIRDGFLGLIEDHVEPLTRERVAGILVDGGTILGSSNKANPSAYVTGLDAGGKPIVEDMTETCMGNIEKYGLEALVCLGGDGTMSAAAPFADRGINCIGVPKTIDNDLYGSDLTFGFMTAVQTATEALDRVHSTAASHHRTLVVEVMGRNAGWLALAAGIASGSDVILIPEIPFEVEDICETVRKRAARGSRATIVCVSEGAKPKGGEQIVDRVDPTSPDPIRLGGIAKWVAERVEDGTGVETRSVVLGHVQRGGTPVAADRVLATRFGHAAAELLRRGERNRLVVMQGGRLGDVDIQSAANKQRLVDPKTDDLVEAARSVYTCFGDGKTKRV